jgi:hypothetical protein
MKRSRFTDSQIIESVKRVEAGIVSRYMPRVGHQHGDVLQMAC